MAARTDPLASLARLRRLETGTARRRLAEEAERLLAAERRADAADAALHSEQEAGEPADYAAWLGRGVAERDRARIGVRHAEGRSAEARDGLASARAAERALELFREERLLRERRRANRRAQASLDDIGAGLHHRLRA